MTFWWTEYVTVILASKSVITGTSCNIKSCDVPKQHLTGITICSLSLSLQIELTTKNSDSDVPRCVQLLLRTATARPFCILAWFDIWVQVLRFCSNAPGVISMLSTAPLNIWKVYGVPDTVSAGDFSLRLQLPAELLGPEVRMVKVGGTPADQPPPRSTWPKYARHFWCPHVSAPSVLITHFGQFCSSIW